MKYFGICMALVVSFVVWSIFAHAMSAAAASLSLAHIEGGKQ